MQVRRKIDIVNCLQDKVALVASVSRGIGAAIARSFAQEGASVVIAERDVDTGKAMADGLGWAFVHTDVNRQANVTKTVQAAHFAYSRIDVSINNATPMCSIGCMTCSVPDGRLHRAGSGSVLSHG